MVGRQVTGCPDMVTGHLGLAPACVGISLFVHSSLIGTGLTEKLFSSDILLPAPPPYKIHGLKHSLRH